MSTYVTVGPREEFPRLAVSLGGLAFACFIAGGLIAGLDGKPLELDDESIWGVAEPWLPETLLILGTLLLPAALMFGRGVRTRDEQGDPLVFAPLPGGRFIAAYAIWLGVTGIPVMVLTCGFSLFFVSFKDFPEQSTGLEEVAVWWAHRAPFLMLGAGLAGGVLLVLALIALAVAAAVRHRQGTATKSQRTAALFGVAMAGLVLLVFGFAFALVLPSDNGTRLAGAALFGGLIVLTTALLFFGGRRRSDVPDTMVNRRLSKEAVIAGFVVLLFVLMGVIAAYLD
ncbi:MAG: hypothetical protein HOV79_26660 [Hamadaea sp.]|nr:hypothetical protein [Hamadaea sp.]